MQDQDRYDIEGPKNLFDQTMLADWFVKMAQDHPLLTYIEDAFAEGDVLGYQKMMRRFDRHDWMNNICFNTLIIDGDIEYLYKV